MDVEPAYAVPGVVRVLTAADVPGVNDAGVKHDEPLFPDEVMFYGHAVCWVLGETEDAARNGAAAIEVDYESLPSLITVQEAIAAESFQGHHRTVSRGDAEAGLAAAAHRFRGEFSVRRPGTLLPGDQRGPGHVDESGQVFVQSSTQHPSETQEIVAHVLGPARVTRVTVQCLRMGGGFGGKEMQPHGFAAIAALGATLTGRPVLLRLNRTQDITMTGKRHPFHASWEVGFDADLRISALRATLTSDGGWSLDLSEPVLARALCHIDNAYWVPDIEVHGQIAKTNKTSQTAFRGFGGPQGMIVIEDILGRCAPLLGVGAGRATATQLLRARPDHPVRSAGPARRAARRHLGHPAAAERVHPAQGRGRGLQRRPPAHQARAGHHPGQVRHLVQPDRVQPGRRAGARLQGRLGADQPWRHRDGPGPAHQDDPGRRHRARACR